MTDRTDGAGRDAITDSTGRMRELAPLPYSHPVQIAHLEPEGATPFAIAPEEAASGAIAGYLGVDAAQGLALEGEVEPMHDRGWRVTARVRATLIQPCVVTLDPVEQVIDEEITRLYLPAKMVARSVEVIVDTDQDAPDPFEDEIDLGALMLEEIALRIDAYPRTPGIEAGPQVFAAPGIAPMTDEDAKPFAGLAALKDKLKGDG